MAYCEIHFPNSTQYYHDSIEADLESMRMSRVLEKANGFDHAGRSGQGTSKRIASRTVALNFVLGIADASFDGLSIDDGYLRQIEGKSA